MGNKVCCEQTRIQKPIIEQTHEQPIQTKKMQVHEPERPEYTERISPLAHPQKRHQQYISIPELLKPVRLTIDNKKFFAKELSHQATTQTRRYADDIYQGDLEEQARQNSKPHGFGRMHKQDGSLYIGYFDHGKAQGKGVFIFRDGSYYNGEFNKNVAETKNGQYWSPSMQYEGGFTNSTFDGEGKETGENYHYIGKFSKGRRINGELTWTRSKDIYKYKGDFNQKNHFHGKGKLMQPHGSYEGDFYDGEKHGFGVYTSENGMRYEGGYINGVREGQGTIYNNDHFVAYKGEMKGGLPHGLGSVYKDGKEMRTKWVEGIDYHMLPEQRA